MYCIAITTPCAACPSSYNLLLLPGLCLLACSRLSVWESIFWSWLSLLPLVLGCRETKVGKAGGRGVVGIVEESRWLAESYRKT